MGLEEGLAIPNEINDEELDGVCNGCEDCQCKEKTNEEEDITPEQALFEITKNVVFYNDGNNQRVCRVKFTDGTSVIATCLTEDPFSEDGGLAIALCKYMFNGHGVIRKLLKEKTVRVDNVPHKKTSDIGFTGINDKKVKGAVKRLNNKTESARKLEKKKIDKSKGIFGYSKETKE